MLFVLLLIPGVNGYWVTRNISNILKEIDRSGPKQRRGWFLYFLGAVIKVLITLDSELYWPVNVSGDPQAHFSLLLIGPQAPAPFFPLAGKFCRRDANGSKILCTYNGI